MPFVDEDVIKVLVGLRRSGKSDMLRLIQQRLLAEGRKPEQFVSLNFEDYSLSPLHNPDKLYPYLLQRIDEIGSKAYVFLDEIQEVRSFEKVINSLRSSTSADVYITGSNSSLLSGELATYLSGRYVQFEIYPFGYAEFADAQAARGASGSFTDFLRIGGMPFIATHNWDDDSRRTYLTDIYRSVVLRDIVQRHRIRDIALLENIIMFAMQSIGNTLSANAIAAYLKSERIDVSPQTVLNYLGYCTDTFLLHKMSRYDIAGKQILKTMQKYYIADHGLRAAIINDGMSQIQGILENVVAMEGLRRGYHVSVGTSANKEVDFVLDKGTTRRYIQVTYLMQDNSTAAREFSAFNSIADNYPKTVVSMDPILQPRNGIEHRHIDEFLLAKDW